ncbi:hypothetical protein HZ993_06905 [Rhodoferax sp. AJA081-3]|uniref:glycine-rich domain-containing protein n=1 Tax=Rhodoferax sp. AJA081-3 TaxID=2752316 RepID=UPI001AE0581E|nr:hypothetical protein [Rhodoferax sp. AJA081-3]QTN29540.1 hypothetical protein HZ993_06905 [Rhodoferax sp. AJA081-3]
MLLCLEHAWEVDQPNRVTDFPPKLLKEWKQSQLDDFDGLGHQGWALTPDMVDEALRSSSTTMNFNNSTVSLGGAGGNAPGAGGGGGGAIGQNARGGIGGPGGGVRYEGIPFPEKRDPETSESNSRQCVHDLVKSAFPADYRLPSDLAPGAGGGGGGAVGPDAVGGNGGGGGEQVLAMIDLSEFHSDGPVYMEVPVGKGGVSNTFPWEHGRDGENSSIKVIAADGRILRTITAAGGTGARANFEFPEGSREVSVDDIKNGLTVPVLITAEFVQEKNGLLYVLGGNWSIWAAPQLPVAVQSALTCVVSFGQAIPNCILMFFIVVEDPSGQEVIRMPFAATNEYMRPVANVMRGFELQFHADVAGVWNVRVLSGRFELARLPLEVRMLEAKA